MMLSLFRLPRVSVLRSPLQAQLRSQAKLYQQPRYFSTTSFLLKEAAAKKTDAKKTKKKTTTKKKPAAKKASAKKAAPKKKKPVKKVKPLTQTQIKKQERPKRPISSFVLYYKEKLPPNTAKVPDALQAIAVQWRNEPESVKQSYAARAAELAKDYPRLKAEWLAKYKRPLTGYTKFIKSTIDRSQCKTLDDAKLQMKELASQWRTFTAEEKEAWKHKEI